MSRATLTPPPAPARAPETSGAHIRVRAPFTRGARDRGGRITPRGVALSVGAHLLLALAVWLAPVRVREVPREAGRAGDPAGAVSYVDIGAWPGTDGGGGAPQAASAAPSAEPGAVATQAPADTATGRAAAPRLDNFPQRAPAGIPAAPRAGAAGGAPGRAPGAPAGVPGGAGGAPRAAGGGAPGAGRSGPAGGRLGSELGDGRLVVTPEAAPERPMTDQERLRARIAARIGAINDSIAEEAGRQRRARNWTVKDRNGREWGIAEGGAPVVAGVKIPGVTLTPPVGRSREAEVHDAEVKRQTDEINRQSDAQDRDRNMRERTRATRERLDRERRQKREGASGNP